MKGRLGQIIIAFGMRRSRAARRGSCRSLRFRRRRYDCARPLGADYGEL